MASEHDLPTNPGENPTTPIAPGSRPSSGTGAVLPRESAPDRIGGYRIVRELGRGGMGVVYLARKDDDRFQRTVAIKIVKRGMDTEDIVRRFETERQVLAAMDHPNIARLLDGGTTEDGRPYFVVEHIEGRPIDKYCDEQRLSIGERLKLFCKVCSAVHYAHQNLVVHRDIKPGNILVTKDGEPKLLDFGIAKLLNPGFSPVTHDPTSPSLRLMTPEYASPEQVRGEIVGTASDVYSLGVLLFELLTGHRPYRLRTRLQAEVERIICEVEPERPSTAISKVEDVPGATGTTTVTPELVAGTREKRPERLRRRLEGDIDNIVLMALRKEPRWRYQSALQFADDIKNHLEGRPVLARRPTVIYRAAKFVRRNRYGVSAAAAIFLALLFGVIGTTVGMQRAIAAEKVAVAQRERAERLFESGRDLANTFLTDFADSVKQLTGALEAQELIVNEGLEYLQETRGEAGDDLEFKNELITGYLAVAEVQAGLRGLGRGDIGSALTSYDAAREIADEVAASNPGSAQAKGRAGTVRLATALAVDRTADTARVVTLLEESVALLEQAVQAGGEYDRQLAVAQLELGLQKMRADQFDDAEKLIRASLTFREQELAKERSQGNLRDVSVAQMRIGSLEAQRGRMEASVAAFRKARDLRIEIKSMDPPDAPTLRARRDVMIAQEFLARALRASDDLPGARAALNGAVAEAEAIVEENPQDPRSRFTLGQTLEALADIEMSAGDLDAAYTAQTRRLDRLNEAASLAPDDVTIRSAIASAHLSLGTIRLRQDRATDAMPSLSRAVAAFEQMEAADSADARVRVALATACWELGKAHVTLGDRNEARALVHRAIALMGSPTEGSLEDHTLEAMRSTMDEIGAN